MRCTGGRRGPTLGPLLLIERERLIECKRWQVAAGPRAVLLRRRLVRRQAVGNVLAAVDVGVLRPTAGVGDDECLIPVKGLDLPDTVILHVLVDVGAFAPRGAFAELSGKNDVPPRRPGCQPIGSHRNERHELHMLIQLPRSQTLAAASECVEVLAHTLLADVDAVEANLDGRVGCKEVGSLIPQATVQVVAVGALQPFDGIGVFEQGLASFQRIDARCQLPGSRSTRCAHGMNAGRDPYREGSRRPPGAPSCNDGLCCGSGTCNRLDHVICPPV